MPTAEMEEEGGKNLSAAKKKRPPFTSRMKKKEKTKEALSVPCASARLAKRKIREKGTWKESGGIPYRLPWKKKKSVFTEVYTNRDRRRRGDDDPPRKR